MAADYRILVVEGNHSSSARLRNWLLARRYRVLSAATVREALEKIHAESPDLVLLNRSTAGPDGLAVARTLRRTQRFADLPILLLTEPADARGRRASLEPDLDDFILQPLRFEEVGVRIRTMLRRRDAFRGLQRANSRLKAANGRLRRSLTYDAKTGLYNYRYFSDRIEEEFKRADRYNNYLTCVMLDLDRFKRVNDRHGHPEGDRVLVRFAEILTQNARETDFVARYGGEEFAALLPQTDGRSARILAERVRTATEATAFRLGRGSVRITVSAGIATYPANPRIRSAGDLVQAADDALYRAKAEGRNRTHLDRASDRSGPLPPPKIDRHLQRRRKDSSH